MGIKCSAAVVLLQNKLEALGLRSFIGALDGAHMLMNQMQPGSVLWKVSFVMSRGVSVTRRRT